MTDKQSTGSGGKACGIVVVAASLFAATGPSALAQSGYLHAMGEAVERVLPADMRIRPPIIIWPGMRMAFGGETYAVEGTDACPQDQRPGHAGCIVVTPGMGKSVRLNPIGTTDWLRGAVSFTSDPDRINILLHAVSYPDGRVRKFAPPLIGVSQ